MVKKDDLICLSGDTIEKGVVFDVLCEGSFGAFLGVNGGHEASEGSYFVWFAGNVVVLEGFVEDFH